MKIEIREATQTELDVIYMMGFDEWADGASEKDYLNECRSSLKYQRGNWFVLETECEGQRQLVSSLIVYKFDENQFGIGSIATEKNLRKRGYASKLITSVLDQIDRSKPDSITFLYSDIDPEFYTAFGFTSAHESQQRYKDRICMVRTTGSAKKAAHIPNYF